MLEKSGVASDLLETLGLAFGRTRGGLGYSVIFVGMLLAASTGIVGATVVMMGAAEHAVDAARPLQPAAGLGPDLRLGDPGADHPAVHRAGHAGRHPAGRQRGQAAQLQVAIWPPIRCRESTCSPGRFLPGLMLVALYAVWQLIVSITRPETCPPVFDEAAVSRGRVEALRQGRRHSAPAADRAGPGLYHGRRRDAHGIGRRRRRRRGGAGLAQPATVLEEASSTWPAAPPRSVPWCSSSWWAPRMFSLVFRGYGGDDMVADFLGNLPGGVFMRHAAGDGGDLRPGVLPRLHRDHLRGRAHRRADPHRASASTPCGWG